MANKVCQLTLFLHLQRRKNVNKCQAGCWFVVITHLRNRSLVNWEIITRYQVENIRLIKPPNSLILGSTQKNAPIRALQNWIRLKTDQLLTALFGGTALPSSGEPLQTAPPPREPWIPQTAQLESIPSSHIQLQQAQPGSRRCGSAPAQIFRILSHGRCPPHRST